MEGERQEKTDEERGGVRQEKTDGERGRDRGRG